MKWQRLAYLCRFAHQDIYRLLGRDPLSQPLSALEYSLFERAIKELLDAEFPQPNHND